MSCDYIELAIKGVQGLRPYVPGKPVEELQRELGLEHVVKLASNENPLGSSAQVVKAIQDELSELTRYPDGNGFILKKALSEKHAIGAECITLGNGSNEILELIARAYLDTESEVIFSEHSFAVYPLVTQAVGAKAVVTPAINWGHDLQAMAQAVTEKTRLIFVANPNNPTGTWVTENELTAFLEQIPERVIVVLDEAYFDYVGEAEYPNGEKLLNRFANLVVTRTFSKAYGMAALRAGYSLSNSVIADVLNRVRQPFNMNHLAMVGAVAALQDTLFIEQSKMVNDSGMEQYIQGFKQLGLGYIPSVGNFICVDLQRDAGPVYENLLQQGVIVRPVANYGMPQHLRITIGTEAENKHCLDALAKALGA